MNSTISRIKLTQSLALLAVVLVALSGCAGPIKRTSQPPSGTALPTIERISRPGIYEGYSQPLYREWNKTSRYVTVRDGTKLAVDIYRPVQDGKLVSIPLPVIWTHNRYHR